MPAYLTGPLNPPPTTLLRGKNAYSIGGFNDLAGRTILQVTNVSLTSDVATLTCKVIAGDAPVEGATAYIQGVPNNSGAFNSSTGVVITDSTFTGATGTISFALSHADVVSAAAAGQVIVDAPETSESVTTGTVPYKGKQFGLPPASAGRSSGDSISWSYSFPGTAPDSVTVQLQGADVDEDANYTVIDSGTAVGGETRPPLSTSGMTGINFMRGVVSAMTGGPSDTVIRIIA